MEWYYKMTLFKKKYHYKWQYQNDSSCLVEHNRKYDRLFAKFEIFESALRSLLNGVSIFASFSMILYLA